MKYQKDDIIRYKIKRSRESLKEAEILSKENLNLGAISSLYYSVFYIVNAYFSFKEIRTKSHSGVRSLLHSELKMKELITAADAKLYDKLFDNRQEADYGDFIVFSKEEVEELLLEARLLIEKIEKLVNS